MLLFLCLILGIYLFILGFQHAFPGETIARYLEDQFEARSLLRVEIEPLEWKNPLRLDVERAALLAPPSVPVSNLFVVENIQAVFFPEIYQLSNLFDVSSPADLFELLNFSRIPSLSEQNIEIRAEAYGGEILGTVNLAKREYAGFIIQKMELDRIPVVNLFPYGFLKGTVEALGSIRNLKELQEGKTQLPKGKLKANLESIRVKFENLDELIPGGLDLPELFFSQIELDLDYNQFLNIRKIQLRGSVEGTIDGKIFLNHRNLSASRIRLHLKLKLSEEVEEALGPMIFFVKGLQCGDEMDFDLLGTVSRINPPKKRTCT
ncbi:MAG: type II secretion system protein GspN [SAR324 cluster bacterium]|nr:type II secretion system protein GspN [SAR324 cluster bacterium]